MTKDISGEYFLQNAREMASGFLLNADNSFQFFFSYGALDRQASGEWKQEGDKILFNSRSWPGSDFTLVRTETGETDMIRIQFEQNNPMLSAYMYASLARGAEGSWEQFDQRGYVLFPFQPFESISLQFEYCPERFTEIPVRSNGQHVFIIRPEQSLAELFLTDFSLNISDAGLNGKHPMMEGVDYLYQKNNV
jgi:hypothetical protein